MKTHACSGVWQPKLPLIDIPALATPHQQELSQALMKLLVQVAHQIGQPASAPKEVPDGYKTNL